MSTVQRDQFTNKFGVLMAAVGSALGLGNLWRFPYLVGTYGGAAFIILYIIFAVIICLPIMYSEFIIGRRTQSNVFGAFQKLAPKTGWSGIGIMSVLASFAIMAFFSVVVSDRCPTTDIKVVGRYFRAETMYSLIFVSFSNAKIRNFFVFCKNFVTLQKLFKH